MSEISSSGFTGAFTIRVFSDPDLYAFAGRLAGLGYAVSQIKLSGVSGYSYLPLDETGSFAKKNYADIYYQPRTFTVVSNDLGNFQLATGELVRALRESGVTSLDYTELTINYERVLSLPKISTNDGWDIRGLTFSRNPLNSNSYEQISVTLINDDLSRYLISIYIRDSYEATAKIISILTQKMRDVEKFIADQLNNFRKKDL